MQAIWKDRVIAASGRATEAGGYVYFPREDVRMDMLRAAPKTASDDACPHGVRFYDVVGEDGASPRAAWSYEKPGPALAKVDHWIGFWNDVRVG